MSKMQLFTRLLWKSQIRLRPGVARCGWWRRHCGVSRIQYINHGTVKSGHGARCFGKKVPHYRGHACILNHLMNTCFMSQNIHCAT